MTNVGISLILIEIQEFNVIFLHEILTFIVFLVNLCPNKDLRQKEQY